MTEKKEMKEILRCPRCNSALTRFRVRTDDRICYNCGEVYKLNSETKNINDG